VYGLAADIPSVAIRVAYLNGGTCHEVCALLQRMDLLIYLCADFATKIVNKITDF